MPVSRWLTLSLALAAVAATSCGGDDDQTPPPAGGGRASTAGRAGSAHGGSGGRPGEGGQAPREDGGVEEGAGMGGDAGEGGAGAPLTGGTSASGGTAGTLNGGGTTSTGGVAGSNAAGAANGAGVGGTSANNGGTAAGVGGGCDPGTGDSGCVPVTCNGAPADPTCACLKVAASGDDALAAASGGVLPFRNIQPAIDFADSHPGAPTKVCVAEGSACGGTTTYAGPSGDLTMRNGISLYGGYEATTWTRCPYSAVPGAVLAPQTDRGVYFGPDIQSPTTLERFTVARFGSATTTAVTLDGAVGATISSSELGVGASGSTTSFGVDALNGADAALDWITMTATGASAPPIQFGIRAASSRLSVHGAQIGLACDVLAGAQSCTGLSFDDTPSSQVEDSSVRIMAAFPGPTGIGVHAAQSAGLSLDGTSIGAFGGGVELIDSPGVHWTGGTLAVGDLQDQVLLLEDSPGATIDVAATSGPQGSVVLKGAAAGTTLRGSLSLSGGYGYGPAGIVVGDCGGDAPTISMSVDMSSVVPATFGIHVSGDCAPTISSTVKLRLFQVSTSLQDPAELDGIRCEAPAKCSVSHSTVSLLGRTQGAVAREFVTATGILCDPGACPLLENSVIRGLSNPSELRDSFYRGGGVYAPGATLIRANHIEALCAGGDGFGLYARGSQRIENNVIQGPTCGGTYSASGGGQSLALAVGLVGGLDVHSNTIDGGGAMDGASFGQVGCSSIGMEGLDAGATIRNNIFSHGDCVVYSSFTGSHAAFENNDLTSYSFNGTLLTTAAAINALPGAANNFTSGSVIDAGTPVGAPATDIDGYPRDAKPDVGAHEYTECNVDNGGCDVLTQCTPMAPSGHACGPCPAGYTGDGTTGCMDVDECSAPESPCPAPSTCVNDVASYHCACPTGYAYSEFFHECQDVDECAHGNGDCGLATCINTEGSYRCGDCPAGYTGDGDTGCVDIDECNEPLSCDPLTTCFNYLGTYGCSPCPAGYSGTGETGCHDVDECKTNNGGCDALTTCTNSIGGRTCSPCPPGYDGDGASGCYGRSPMVSIAVGETQACGLRADGSIDCWGAPGAYYGDSRPVGETFSSVTVGYGHTCALRTDKTVVCWGGQLTGTTPSGAFDAISAGSMSDCGLRPDGSAECWGSYGPGTMTAPPGPFVAIQMGTLDVCALRADHSVACWGTNTSGVDTSPPPALLEVDVGPFGACGIDTDHELACWGGGYYPWWGQIEPAGAFEHVATGVNGACALAADRTIACWGISYHGETTPPPGAYKALGFGNGAACAIRDDDAIVCWGDASGGLLDGPPR